MLGVSGMLGNSGDGTAPAAEATESAGNGGCEGGVGGPSSGGLSEEEKARIEVDGDRSSGGNRWPRQETLALLKIRSDMDAAFRDSSLKGPLWEEVSRKLAELGYHRSAKKCKEKFENVYKYHKRTKEGRASKSDGKTYRFFDQLEALDNNPMLPPPPPRPQNPQPSAAAPAPVPAQMPGTIPPPIATHVATTVPSPINSVNPTNPLPSNPIYSVNFPVNFGSSSSSSSTSSDEEPERRYKRKRKWEGFFERLMKEVMQKQEEMQKRFLETLERRERERMSREEAWRMQEIARMNREHDLLVQERSIAAAKDAAVIAFLQKVSEQNQISPNVPQQLQTQMQTPPQPQLQPQQQQQPQSQQQQQQPQPQPSPTAVTPQPPPPVQQPSLVITPPPTTQTIIQSPGPHFDAPKTDNGGESNLVSTNPSRWPKAEVQALIRLRTSLDLKYQQNGPKGPLWEEISAAMCKLGYRRSAKRCKEKWENINKYFKKVKESNKKRPEDSKTCPYFHQLDALYKERAKSDNSTFNNTGFPMKPENMIPIMVQPEQQWPLPPEQQPAAAEDNDGDEEDDGDGDGDEDDDDEEDEAVGYEIVTNKGSSVGTVE
ncbi:hypothetical protein NMG60_11032917 [Bertholletia excelsa]